jgi:hypothetical protein
MSANGIGALERGYRRTPQRETLALLVDALALNAEQRRVFEAAARSGVSKRIDPDSVALGPCEDSTAADSASDRVQIARSGAVLSRPARSIALTVILIVALSSIGVFILRSTKSAGAKPSQAVTTLGSFRFDVSPSDKSKIAVIPVGILPANSMFAAIEGQTVEVACSEETYDRAGGIRHQVGTPPTPLPPRFRLIIDGTPGSAYTVGAKFMIDMNKIGTTRASHTFRVDPLDTVPNSSMIFSCVTIVSSSPPRRRIRAVVSW